MSRLEKPFNRDVLNIFASAITELKNVFYNYWVELKLNVEL